MGIPTWRRGSNQPSWNEIWSSNGLNWINWLRITLFKSEKDKTLPNIIEMHKNNWISFWN